MADIFQEYIIELYKNPLNFGAIPDADYSGEVYNSTCGDKVILYLKVKGGKVVEARHAGSGCAISQASASLFTEHIKGMKFADVAKLGKADALKLIRVDLSKNPSRMKCALLPLDALRKAIGR